MLLKRTVTGLFLGRDGEVETLKGVASATSNGTAMGVFISGPRGIGKTELLKQLFIRLSTTQQEVIPFYYSINPAISSLRDFSGDYLTSLIRQALSFLKKDPSIMGRPVYSPDDIRPLINTPEIQWATELIDEYSGLMKRADALSVFRYAISTPIRCYLSSGRPVIVMIDDFERLKGLEDGDCWRYMEEFINNPYTPHIITGLDGELHEMLFERTSIGRNLELMRLKGLGREDSLGLFNSLCRINNLNVIKPPSLVDHLNGNPLYIRRFVNIIRRHGNMLHEDHLQRIYQEEIKDGEFFVYWSSHLRRYVPGHLRSDTLSLLYHLCSDELDGVITPDEASSLVSREHLNSVFRILRVAGVLEEDFGTFRLINDRVFIDVIRSLHQTGASRRERPRHRVVPETRRTTFEVRVPATGGYEGVVVKLLEEVGHRYGVSSEVIGKLQVALAEVLNSLFTVEGSTISGVDVRFDPEDDGLTIEVDVPEGRLYIETPDGEASLKLIKGIVDDIRIERLQGLTRLTMVKRFKHNPFTTHTGLNA
jgi:hypothetical protein